MDLWSLHLNNTSQIHTHLSRIRNNFFPKKSCYYVESSSGLEIRQRSRVHRRSFVVTAAGKKNNDNSSYPPPSSGDGDQSVPEGEGFKGKKPSHDGSKANDIASEKSKYVKLDWREFRASLYVREQAEKVESDAHEHDGMSHEYKPLAQKWAHPLAVPETGCVLVATEKLDGVRTFERTVVLLLRSGNRNPQEGPFGVVLNRPLHKKMKHMKPSNTHLATTFADCSLHFGGPLEASTFLLKVGEKLQLPLLEEVVPGLCFGARNSLDKAAELVRKGMLKAQNFRFFVGYAGWQIDQLREEIESDYWYVASCSPNLINGDSPDLSDKLWEEILQLMGGHYSELSRKPRLDM